MRLPVYTSTNLGALAARSQTQSAAVIDSTYCAGNTEFLGEQLREDISVMVAVVGDGFTGVSTELHLRELGIDVALFEGTEIGAGASGRNDGQVNPGLKPGANLIEDTFGPDLASA